MDNPALQDDGQNVEYQKYKVILDTAPDAVLIFDVDQDKFIDYNDNSLSLLKISPEKLLQSNPLDISSPSVHGKQTEAFVNQYIFEALAGGNPLFEWVYMTDEGEEVPCQVRLVRFPPYNKNIIAGGLIDLREKIKRDKIFKEQQERLKLTLESTGLACYDWDELNSELLWDAKMYELLGVNEESSEDNLEAFLQIIHPEDKQTFIDIYRNALKEKGGETSYEYEFRIIKNKQIRDIYSNGTVFRDKSGLVTRIIGTLKDITEDKIAQKEHARLLQLEARNKELEQFAYIASHDLQEPLRTVISFIRLIKEKKDRECIEEYLNYIEDCSTRMNSLINDLLDYSRIGQNLKFSPVPTGQVLDRVLDDLNTMVAEAKAHLKIKKELPVVRGRETELRTLFQNLISNAIKYRSNHRPLKVEIDVHSRDKEYVFSISDNGIGIDPENFRKIFILFQRLHNNEEIKGNGIGLTYCQKIVEAHGGKIWLESKKGEGSTFYFSLPM